MQSDQHFYLQKVVPPLAHQVGGSYVYNDPVTPALGVTLPPLGTKRTTPLHGVELQPLEVCPKNFIIFDQTDNRSRIMFHPGLSHKFNCPGLDMHATYIQDYGGKKDVDKEKRESSSDLKEDTKDIDALLSLEEEDQEEDEDEVSTARTLGSCGSSSPDSCSSYSTKSIKRRLSSSNQKLSSGSSCKSDRKQQKMKKMVKALRGIVPGGNQMSTVAVLDEAVRYLKSLKVEVKNLGIGNFKN